MNSRILAGDKVILRKTEVRDRELLLNLSQDPEITRVTKGYSSPGTGFQPIRNFHSVPESAGSLRRIIAAQESPEAGLGMITLSNTDRKNQTAEIYIKILKPARQKGYGRDAVNVLVSYAFGELQLNSVRSSILEYNTASRRLFESCGFQLVNVHKSSADREGHCRNVCIYEKKRELLNF